MDATLYTGNGGTQSITNAGIFKPDLVWVKSRSAATDNKLTDSVRGVTKALISNTSGGETTDSNGLTAFNTNGFTLGSDTNYNNNTATYVGWQWQAGQGNTVVNSTGTVTANVSTNTTAGFSVAKWTSTSTGAATIGHGLGVAPACILIKLSSASGNFWTMYHQSLGNTTRLCINNTDPASAANANFWNNTSPTSSVFSVGQDSNTNGNSYVGYIWTPIAGFSQFGSYTGNGSADGPFIYTGFRPKFILWKCTTTGATDWDIYDSVRDPYNAANHRLIPDSSGAEQTLSPPTFDILSNGFKLRYGYSSSNNNGDNYIYAAFAETPFKYSNAR